MAETYSIAFEQVELIEGLAPDQAVWLYMRATLKDAANPDIALDVREVGAFPPDANRLVPDGYAEGDSGIFAPGLEVPVPTRNDTKDNSTGQIFPRFELDPIAVGEGQILEVDVFMTPKVWFKEITIPEDQYDAWTKKIFLTALGAGGFGVVGVIASVALQWLFGSDTIDVTVPCSQMVIATQTVFTLDDLRQLETEPMRQYGPNNAEEGICGYIDSFYWLSANQHMPLRFPTPAPIQPQDCELRPWRHDPVGDWLGATWLDRVGWENSCLAVQVTMTAADRCDVYVYDHPQTGTAPRAFLRRPVSEDRAPNQFAYNFYGDDCPARSASPTCPNCKRFTNLPKVWFLPIKMVVALAFAPRHVGTERWTESMIARGLTARSANSPSCAETDRQRGLLARGTGEAAQLGPGLLYRMEGRDRIALWPAGTPAPKPVPDPQTRHASRHTHPFSPTDVAVLHDGSSILDVLFGCYKVPLGDREALFTYAEVPAHGDPTCPRLRYILWDDVGKVVKDVMLQVWIKPPS